MDINRTKEIVAELLNRTTANGCTEGEAAVAISKAQQLLAKHGLTIQDINREPEQIQEQKVQTETKSLSAIQVTIALALKDHFGVEVIKSQKGSSSYLKVIGEQIKCDIFTEVFTFAYNAFKSNWTRFNKTMYCSTQEKNLHRGTYLRGFCDGFTNEIIKQENATALVVVKSEELQSHMAAKRLVYSRGYVTKSSGSAEVYANGYEQGAYAQKNKHKVLD